MTTQIGRTFATALLVLTASCTCMREVGHRQWIRECGSPSEYREDEPGSHAMTSTLEPQKEFYFLNVGGVISATWGSSQRSSVQDLGDGLTFGYIGVLTPVDLFELGAGAIIGAAGRSDVRNGVAHEEGAHFALGGYVEASRAFWFLTSYGLPGHGGGAFRMAVSAQVVHEPGPKRTDATLAAGVQMDIVNFRFAILYGPTWRDDHSPAELTGWRHGFILRLSYAAWP